MNELSFAHQHMLNIYKKSALSFLTIWNINHFGVKKKKPSNETTPSVKNIFISYKRNITGLREPYRKIRKKIEIKYNSKHF